MPSWLQAFAEVNPLRELFLGVPAPGNSILWAIAWSAGLIAAFAPLAIARYRRAVTK